MTEEKQPLKKELDSIDKKLINQSEIARRLGYSYAYISMILNNKRKNDKLLEKIKEIIKSAA